MPYKCLVFAGQEDFLSNIVHLSNAGSMLGQRRRRWLNINTALDQCLVWVVSCNQFSGYINAVNLYSIGYCWPTLDRPRHAHFAVESFFNISFNSVCENSKLSQFSRIVNRSMTLPAAFLVLSFTMDLNYYFSSFTIDNNYYYYYFFYNFFILVHTVGYSRIFVYFPNIDV